jgi:hypothetical protein
MAAVGRSTSSASVISSRWRGVVDFQRDSNSSNNNKQV